MWEVLIVTKSQVTKSQRDFFENSCENILDRNGAAVSLHRRKRPHAQTLQCTNASAGESPDNVQAFFDLLFFQQKRRPNLEAPFCINLKTV